MRNIKFKIEYDGTYYLGWQVQKVHNSHKKSIQEVIENALQKILSEKIRLIASGRTDAGVHALAQVANFKTGSIIPVRKLQRALNAVLPDDIVITKAQEAGLGFHSRFSVKSKVYRYTILNRAYPSALLKDKVYFYPYPLDVALMRKESAYLAGRHDFKAFCASLSSAKNTVRTIKQVSVKRLPYNSLPVIRTAIYNLRESSIITIDIEADGFLHNMVRSIVGTLIEIGRGRFPKGSMRRIMRSKDRRLAGQTAPAKGLCLIKVNY